MWSTVATSSARRRGWLSGRTWTAIPILTRRVRAARAEARGGQNRSVLLEVDLGQPYGIKAKVLGRPHLGQGFVERRCVRDARRARKFREQTEFHPTLPIEFGISYARASRDGGPTIGGYNARRQSVRS